MQEFDDCPKERTRDASFSWFMELFFLDLLLGIRKYELDKVGSKSIANLYSRVKNKKSYLFLTNQTSKIR